MSDFNGIDLTSRTVLRRMEEIRQRYPDLIKVNHKYMGLKPKSDYRWYKIIEKLRTEIVAYTNQMGFKPSPRTMYYHLQDLKIITPKDLSYFTKATVKARLRYTDSNREKTYPVLPIDCFADDDQRKTVGDYDGDEEPKDAIPGEIVDPITDIEKMIKDLKEAANAFLGEPEGSENSEMGGRWYNQPEYVEVWEEKNDLLPGFDKILKDRSVKIRANKGYASLDFLRRSTIELKEEIIEGMGIEPKNIFILYCGDWDPSGAGMDYYMRKRVRQLGLPDEIADNFTRVAVTKSQIEEYNLPLNPLEKGNPNTKEFIRQHGTKATHLNAFFTQAHFKAFEKILLAAVDKHWKQEIYDELKDKYDDNAPEDEPESYTAEQLKEKRQEIYRKITKEFASGWYKGLPDAPYYW